MPTYWIRRTDLLDRYIKDLHTEINQKATKLRRWYTNQEIGNLKIPLVGSFAGLAQAGQSKSDDGQTPRDALYEAKHS